MDKISMAGFRFPLSYIGVDQKHPDSTLNYDFLFCAVNTTCVIKTLI